MLKKWKNPEKCNFEMSHFKKDYFLNIFFGLFVIFLYLQHKFIIAS